MAVLGYTAIKFWVYSQLAYCLYGYEALALVSSGTTMQSFQAWAGVTGSVLFAHAETKAKCWGASAGSLAGSNLLQVRRIWTQYRAAGNLEGRLEKAFVGTWRRRCDSIHLSIHPSIYSPNIYWAFSCTKLCAGLWVTTTHKADVVPGLLTGR